MPTYYFPGDPRNDVPRLGGRPSHEAEIVRGLIVTALIVLVVIIGSVGIGLTLREARRAHDTKVEATP